MSYSHFLTAILGELLGTSLLKLSDGFAEPVPTVSAPPSYGVCFCSLSLVTRKIPLRVTYATWSTVSLVLTALTSAMILKETLNVYSIIGLILIIIGVVMANLLGNVGH